jgi:hypothetical protein
LEAFCFGKIYRPPGGIFISRSLADLGGFLAFDFVSDACIGDVDKEELHTKHTSGVGARDNLRRNASVGTVPAIALVCKFQQLVVW